MKLIVGLGNPGKDYENTRHNIGFMILDNYLKECTWQKKFNAEYTTTSINGEKVILVKPMTYMNLSGDAVVEFVNYFKINAQDVLVIQDDLDLPFGKYRIKTNSSDGGHNGIKSIINRLGTKSFARLKIGISHNANGDTKDYVLGKFNKEQINELENLYSIFNNIIEDFTQYDIEKLMNKYNGV